MEVKVESKIGNLQKECSQIYAFLSDCNNFSQLAANDRIKNWRSDADSCSFTVDGIGDAAFCIVERRESELIKFAIDNAQAEDAFLWVQLKAANFDEARIKLTVKLKANKMLSMMISKPLKQGLDKLVDTLEYICSKD